MNTNIQKEAYAARIHGKSYPKFSRLRGSLRQPRYEIIINNSLNKLNRQLKAAHTILFKPPKPLPTPRLPTLSCALGAAGLYFVFSRKMVRSLFIGGISGGIVVLLDYLIQSNSEERIRLWEAHMHPDNRKNLEKKFSEICNECFRAFKRANQGSIEVFFEHADQIMNA